MSRRKDITPDHWITSAGAGRGVRKEGRGNLRLVNMHMRQSDRKENRFAFDSNENAEKIKYFHQTRESRHVNDGVTRLNLFLAREFESDATSSDGRRMEMSDVLACVLDINGVSPLPM